LRTLNGDGYTFAVVAEIVQSKNGYRYSLDPFILADFVDAPGAKRIIDFGAGNGILTLLLSVKFPDAMLVGVDIQSEPLRHAVENASRSGGRFTFIRSDIRNSGRLIRPGSFDLAVSNPPYRKAGSGRVNPSDAKAVARHELMLSLDELIRAARHSLADGGRFCLVHLAQRSAELLHRLKENSFAPHTMRFVHSRESEDAFLVAVTAVKNGRNPVTVKPPLVVYSGDGRYSREMNEIYERSGI